MVAVFFKKPILMDSVLLGCTYSFPIQQRNSIKLPGWNFPPGLFRRDLNYRVDCNKFNFTGKDDQIEFSTNESEMSGRESSTTERSLANRDKSNLLRTEPSGPKKG